MTVKYLDEKKIALVDMACPREECVETKEHAREDDEVPTTPL